MTIARRQYAQDEAVRQAGIDAFNSTYATEIGNGKSPLEARKVAKQACQLARITTAQALVGAE